MTAANDKGHHLDVSNDDPARVAAATLIQRMWRNRPPSLTPDQRWQDAATELRLEVRLLLLNLGPVNPYLSKAFRSAANEGENTPRLRWKRAVFLVGRLQDNNRKMSSGANIRTSTTNQKHLETQHWLELIDGWVLLLSVRHPA